MLPDSGSPLPAPFVHPFSSMKVAIVYEDFASGARARHFVEQLAKRLESACDISRSLWRSELLGLPSIAQDAARDAAECDYLVVSLRGDHVPSHLLRHWVKDQLETAAARGAAVIFLSDANHGKRRAVEATRSYFRSLCAFFSLVTSAPESNGIPSDIEAVSAFATPPSGQTFLQA
jgi:hypothetical protein